MDDSNSYKQSGKNAMMFLMTMSLPPLNTRDEPLEFDVLSSGLGEVASVQMNFDTRPIVRLNGPSGSPF